MRTWDRFALRVKCPNCEVAGTVEVSEEVNPYTLTPAFRIDALPAGFEIRGRSFHRKTTVVICTDCRVQALL